MKTGKHILNITSIILNLAVVILSVVTLIQSMHTEEESYDSTSC